MQSHFSDTSNSPANANDKAREFYAMVQRIADRAERFKTYLEADDPRYSEGKKFQMQRYIQDAEIYLAEIEEFKQQFFENLARIKLYGQDYSES